MSQTSKEPPLDQPLPPTHTALAHGPQERPILCVDFHLRPEEDTNYKSIKTVALKALYEAFHSSTVYVKYHHSG